MTWVLVVLVLVGALVVITAVLLLRQRALVLQLRQVQDQIDILSARVLTVVATHDVQARHSLDPAQSPLSTSRPIAPRGSERIDADAPLAAVLPLRPRS